MGRVCYNKFMVKDSATQPDAKVETKLKPGKRLKNARDVTEELKLGKFEQCKPLHLPEKQVRRGWQIVGAVALMLVTILGVYILLLSDVGALIWGNGVMDGGSVMASTPEYALVMQGMVLLMTIGCFVASVMMFAKRKVPVWLWYALIVVVLIGLVSASFHRFRLYEQRECYNNYPGIVDLGYACPSVVNELGLVVLIDMAVGALAAVASWAVWRVTRPRGNKKRR